MNANHEELRELAGLVRVMQRVMRNYTSLARNTGHLPVAQKAQARVEEALTDCMARATDELHNSAILNAEMLNFSAPP